MWLEKLVAMLGKVMLLWMLMVMPFVAVGVESWGAGAFARMDRLCGGVVGGLASRFWQVPPCRTRRLKKPLEKATLLINVAQSLTFQSKACCCSGLSDPESLMPLKTPKLIAAANCIGLRESALKLSTPA